jgi:hypothetical protein
MGKISSFSHPTSTLQQNDVDIELSSMPGPTATSEIDGNRSEIVAECVVVNYTKLRNQKAPSGVFWFDEI